jgi:hypothetical protein
METHKQRRIARRGNQARGRPGPKVGSKGTEADSGLQPMRLFFALQVASHDFTASQRKEFSSLIIYTGFY